MQKKLSKHFIYNWLGEDAYGEFLLHGVNTHLRTKHLLLTTWKTLEFKSNVFQGVSGLFIPRFISFTLSLLRRRFIVKYSLLNTLRSAELIVSTVTWYKIFLLNKLKPIYLHPKLAVNKKKKYLKNRRKLTLVLFKNKLSKRFSWVRYIYRLKRRRNFFFINKRQKDLSLYSAYKLVLKKFFSCPSKKMNLTKFKNRNLKSSVDRRQFWKKRGVFNKNKSLAYLKRKLLYYSNLGLKFFKINTSKEGVSLNRNFSWRFLPFSPKTYLKEKINTFFKNTSLVKKQLLYTNWDNLGYRLKTKTYKFLSSRRAKKLSFQPQFTFSGIFKKDRRLVKKSEKSSLLKFRLLYYSNIVYNSKEYFSFEKSIPRWTKILRLPSLSYLEFTLVSSLLRANFFENGYITASLSKRGLFLINGFPVVGNVSLREWDLVTVSKPLWWLVYARFISYFLIVFSNPKKLLRNKSLPKIFFRKIFNTKYLLRKFRNYKKSLKKNQILNKIISTKNLILMLPPSYMEVSYKLLVFVMHSLVLKSSDLTYAPTTKNFKNFVTNTNNLSVNTFLKLPY